MGVMMENLIAPLSSNIDIFKIDHSGQLIVGKMFRKEGLGRIVSHDLIRPSKSFKLPTYRAYLEIEIKIDVC